jgi:hypothetical protein
MRRDFRFVIGDLQFWGGNPGFNSFLDISVFPAVVYGFYG